jgi:hypothetical protein
MNKMIENINIAKNVRKSRTFSLTENALLTWNRLSPRACELLMSMIHRVGSKCDLSDLIVEGTYEDFGFSSRQLFYKYRKELKDAGFLLYEGKHHYVSTGMIEYESRRQIDYFKRLFGIVRDIKPNFGALK